MGPLRTRRDHTMGYRLGPNVSFCMVEGQAIFLDLGRDRYFALPEPVQTAFGRLAEDQRVGPDDADALSPLLAAGLLIEVASDAAPQPAVLSTAPRSSIFDSDDASLLGSLLAAFAYQTAMAARLRGWSLLKVVDRLRRRRQRIADHLPADSTPDYRRIVASAWRLERYLSSTDRCLLQSLTLADRLIGGGCPVTLVFGVRTSPFSAHCWVQLGDLVLNDSVDHARIYAART